MDFLCVYGWPSSGYGSTLSLLTQGFMEATMESQVCFLAPKSVARGGSVACESQHRLKSCMRM